MASDIPAVAESERLERILERKKRFLVNGKQFAFPRRIKDLIYYRYERKQNTKGWVYRVFCSCLKIEPIRTAFDASKIKRFKVSVYRKALEFSRNQALDNFDRKLRQSSKGNVFENNYLAFRQICFREKIDLQVRESDSKNIYIKHLKKQKYG